MRRSIALLGFAEWKQTLKDVFSFGRKEYDEALNMKRQLLSELQRVQGLHKDLKDTKTTRVPELLKQMEEEVQRLKDRAPSHEEALKNIRQQLPKHEDLLAPQRLNQAFDDAVRDPATSKELKKVLAAFQAKTDAGGSSMKNNNNSNNNHDANKPNANKEKD